MSTLSKLQFAVIALLATLCSSSAIAQFELELATSTTTLDVDDPIIARVSVKNGSDKPITIANPFGIESGAIQFEIKSEESPTFERIRIRGEGLLCVGEAVRRLAAQETWNYYLILWKDGSLPIFEQPGTCLVRAAFKVNDDRRVTPSVSLTVNSIADADRENRRLPQELERFVGLGYAVDLDGNISELRNALKAKQECRMKSLLQFTLSLNKLRFGKSSDNSFGECLKLLKAMDEISREAATLSFARQFIAMDRYDHAEHFLLKLVRPGDQQSEMLRALKRTRENRKRRDGAI